MPRADKPKITPNGRPQKLIDWELVDSLLEAGCFGTEIAPHFDMHHETFYDRVQMEKGMGFTEYSSQKRSKGDSLLRKTQYDKALEGENMMLVWLGKNRLSQRDTAEISVAQETIKTFVSVMDNIREFQDTRKNPAKPPEQPKKFFSPFPKEDDNVS